MANAITAMIVNGTVSDPTISPSAEKYADEGRG